MIKELSLPPSKRKSLQNKITNAINRYVWVRDPNRTAVEARCKVKVAVGTYLNGKTEYRVKFKCEGCGAIVDKIDIDHTEPRVNPETGFVSFDDWIDRTFVNPSQLKGLCKEVCHRGKTNEENRRR